MIGVTKKVDETSVSKRLSFQNLTFSRQFSIRSTNDLRILDFRTKGGGDNETFRTLILVEDAQLGRFRAGERIVRGSSRGAGPVSGLLVLRTRESYGTVVAIVPEGRK